MKSALNPLPGHPQIAACFPGASDRPAVDLCTLKMRVSLWGPPERLTLTLGKNDVWDRRRAWDPPYPMSRVWAGAFAECNEGEPKEQAEHRHRLSGIFSNWQENTCGEEVTEGHEDGVIHNCAFLDKMETT